MSRGEYFLILLSYIVLIVCFQLLQRYIMRYFMNTISLVTFILRHIGILIFSIHKDIFSIISFTF